MQNNDAQDNTYVISDLATAFQTLSDAISNIFEEYAKGIQESSSVLSQLVARINQITYACFLTPGLDKKTDALIESYKKWAHYGWTVIPGAPGDLFDQIPENRNSADCIAKKYCKKDMMQDLFSDIGVFLQRKIEKKDFEEALFCFENRQYKASALILCALIDGIMIRNQRVESEDEYLATGKKAANKLDTEIRSIEDVPIRKRLAYMNMFECIADSFFKDGKNFSYHPEVLNRNFIDHGMYTRYIRRRDVIQLFLAYYNLLECCDYLSLAARRAKS